MKVVSEVRIKDGKLDFKQRSSFLQDVSKFKDGDYVITVEKRKKKRSISQNAYLHLLFTMFTNELNELGNEFQMLEVKELLKYKFLKIEVVNQETGQIIGERVKHTSELTTTDMMGFIENIIRYGAEMFHFNLPYPEEQINLEFD